MDIDTVTWGCFVFYIAVSVIWELRQIIITEIQKAKTEIIQRAINYILPQLCLKWCQAATKVQKPKLQFHLKLRSKHVKWSHSNDMGRRKKGRWGGRERRRGPPGGKTNLDIHRSREQSPPGETMPVINKGWQSELSINTVCMAGANLLCKQTNNLFRRWSL